MDGGLGGIDLPTAIRALGIVSGPDGAILDRIHRADVGLALWLRSLPPAIDVWLRTLAPQCLPDGRVLALLNDLPAAVSSLFERTPPTESSLLLQADVVALARRYAALAGCGTVDVRLEALSSDACWKFHRDSVELRLLTTYRGPTTQFVAPIDAAQAVAEQRAFSGRIIDQPRDSVALFKGALDGRTGVVHRSPPIEGREITRLLLCVNRLSAASPELWGA